MKLYFPTTFQLQYFAPWLWFFIIRFWFYKISPQWLMYSAVFSHNVETGDLKRLLWTRDFQAKRQAAISNRITDKKVWKTRRTEFSICWVWPTRDLATKVNDCGWHAVTIRRHSKKFIGLEDHQRVVNNAREKQLSVYLHGNHSLYRVDINPRRFLGNK